MAREEFGSHLSVRVIAESCPCRDTGRTLIVPDPKNINEATTLAELREQRRLLNIHTIRLYLLQNGDKEELLEAVVFHATGCYMGTGHTEATAIEAAFAKLRHALLPAPLKLKQYLATMPEDP